MFFDVVLRVQVLVLSNEGSFDPHTLLVNGGVLALSSPAAEARG